MRHATRRASALRPRAARVAAPSQRRSDPATRYDGGAVRKRRARRVRPVVADTDASLLDLVDHVLTKGVVLGGDVMLGLAGVDLIYLRLTALLCAADRILPPAGGRARRQPVAPSVARGRTGSVGPGRDPSRGRTQARPHAGPAAARPRERRMPRTSRRAERPMGRDVRGPAEMIGRPAVTGPGPGMPR
jgi:hypothetical protein